jgi:hypothetical protein
MKKEIDVTEYSPHWSVEHIADIGKAKPCLPK